MAKDLCQYQANSQYKLNKLIRQAAVQSKELKLNDKTKSNKMIIGLCSNFNSQYKNKDMKIEVK